MVRDEIDIIDAWLNHAITLFDFVYITDHHSSDGTYEHIRELSRRDSGINVFRYIEAKFAKRDVLEQMRSHALEHTDAEWFFYLDPDEFLPFDSRNELSGKLAAIGDANVAQLYWRNCYLETPYFDCRVLKGYRQVRPSKIGKVAIRRSAALDRRYEVTLGAHSIRHETTGVVRGPTIGELYHFPVRSVDHLWRKLLTGTTNRLRALHDDPSSPSHWHYPAILEQFGKSPDWENVSALVWDYGEHRNRRPRTVDAEEFEPWTFDFAGLVERSGKSAAPVLSSAAPYEVLSKEKNAALLNDLISLNVPNLVRIPDTLLQIHNNLIAQKADFGHRSFSRLDDANVDAITPDDLLSALQSAFWEIKHPVASTWGEHIPFMFSLITLMKPRCYVELGVHNGASFFAACQAVQQCSLATTCVAVDSWLGDAHAGNYKADVFQNFASSLKEFSEFAGYIRANFDQAVERFEDGAIDLLHIDGLHTAHAVQTDFNTWLAKLSNKGIIVFHDINEFRSDFGVWRFWRSVRAKYPHIEFGHGHGLGILLVGEACPLRQQVEGWPTSVASPIANEFLQVIYGGIGHLAWKQAMQPKNQPSSTCLRELTASRDNAQQRVLELEGDIAGFKNSTSWRITKPLRALKLIFKRS